MENIFLRHKRATLMYSGGKDSLCCLLLLRPYWDKLDVAWVNTGNQFPEVCKHMDIVRKLVPHFIELRSDTVEYQKQNGLPVDVVITRHTNNGRFLYGDSGFHVCDRFACCGNNVWRPVLDYVSLMKPTCIMRGDRGTERLEGPHSVQGVEFFYPIFGWTHEQVMRVVRNAPNGLYQPRHELHDNSSLSCMSCTAYRKRSVERLEYLKTAHPDIYNCMVAFHSRYQSALLDEIENMGD